MHQEKVPHRGDVLGEGEGRKNWPFMSLAVGLDVKRVKRVKRVNCKTWAVKAQFNQ